LDRLLLPGSDGRCPQVVREAGLHSIFESCGHHPLPVGVEGATV